MSGAVPCSLQCLEEMAECFCEFAHWFSISEKSDKELGQDEMHRGEEGLVGFGREDVEIKFYIHGCFMVPFTRQQVQGY